MMIEIIDAGNVIQDGTVLGAIADTIANNPALASEIQLALQTYWQEREAAFEAEKGDVADQQQQAVEAATASLKLEHSAELESVEATYRAEILSLTQQLQQSQDALDVILNPPVKWGQFRMEMMGDAAYDRIKKIFQTAKRGQDC